MSVASSGPAIGFSLQIINKKNKIKNKIKGLTYGEGRTMWDGVNKVMWFGVWNELVQTFKRSETFRRSNFKLHCTTTGYDTGRRKKVQDTLSISWVTCIFFLLHLILLGRALFLGADTNATTGYEPDEKQGLMLHHVNFLLSFCFHSRFTTSNAFY